MLPLATAISFLAFMLQYKQTTIGLLPQHCQTFIKSNATHSRSVNVDKDYGKKKNSLGTLFHARKQNEN